MVATLASTNTSHLSYLDAQGVVVELRYVEGSIHIGTAFVKISIFFKRDRVFAQNATL